MMNVPTPHIAAKQGEIAKTVLMPGDPLRAKFIAETYLENAVLVNNVRNVQGYTGTFQGKPVTVMASGMGHSSIGIYSYELYMGYDVDVIIRVGSCGSFLPDLHVRDVVIAMGTCTNTNFLAQFNMPGTFAPIADFGLVRRAAELCEARNANYAVGNILSSDMFYNLAGTDMEWAKMGVLGVEMESAALYSTAAWCKKKALTLCTVSDSFVHPDEKLSAEERQSSFTEMIEIALGLV